MKIIIKPERSKWTSLIQRPVTKDDSIETTVASIFEDIKRNGDSDVIRYTSIFDGVELKSIYVTKKEFVMAEKEIDSSLKAAIITAKENITKFHESQVSTPTKVITSKGITCWQEKRPIESVGLYIPGGTAPLFSSVLMLAIPAQLAGCDEIVLTTPPDKNGKINPAILYTAALCGVKKIIKVGGIQAIAALTLGTESISPVYKIFGPGNQYVTAAKQWATRYGVAIDMPAGPSELLVVADDTANPLFVASDLLSQAEHGVDSQVLLVSTSDKLIENVIKELETQLKEIERYSIAKQALKYAKFIYLESENDAIDLINEYAPEHFITCTSNNEFYCKNIKNAGSVFIGDYTPESAGDYASGTNHTLPTNGCAKAYSGINLDAFLKTISFQEITGEGLLGIGRTIEIMAEAEGLQAHSRAVQIRLDELNKIAL
jgi:histidinol dehydrogenase